MYILIIGISVSPTDTVKVITDPPQGTRYDSLKSEILIWNSKSSESQFHTLLHDEHLGDRTPYEFLSCIHHLSDDAPGESLFINKLHFCHLSHNIQTILANMVNTNAIDQISVSVDRIVGFSHCPTMGDKVVAASSSSLTTQPASTGKDTTLKAIEPLTRQVSSLCHACATFQHCLQRQSSHCHSSPITTSSTICWYHLRFKENARWCVKTCSFGHR